MLLYRAVGRNLRGVYEQPGDAGIVSELGPSRYAAEGTLSIHDNSSCQLTRLGRVCGDHPAARFHRYRQTLLSLLCARPLSRQAGEADIALSGRCRWCVVAHRDLLRAFPVQHAAAVELPPKSMFQ